VNEVSNVYVNHAGGIGPQKRAMMLEITTNNLGNATIFRCVGRITLEHADLLRMIVLKQAPSTAVLDLAEITAIDVAGVGILVSLRWWAKTTGARLKLMNLTPRVEDLLELFNLKSMFEICSVSEMLSLLCLAFEKSQFARGKPSGRSPGQFVDFEPVYVE
jgi:anti-sigma B factor antagonist